MAAKFLMIVICGGSITAAVIIEWARRAHRNRVERKAYNNYKNSRINMAIVKQNPSTGRKAWLEGEMQKLERLIDETAPGVELEKLGTRWQKFRNEYDMYYQDEPTGAEHDGL